MTKERWTILFAARIRSRMDDCRMTKKELISKCGLDRKTFDRYYHGDAIPNAIAVVNIAKALQCSVSYLIDFGEKVEGN